MYDHILYTKDCATKLKAIGHTDQSPRHHIISGAGSMDELLQNIDHADEGYHLLASDNIDGKIGYESDSPTDRQMNQFCIVKRVAIADFAARADAKRDCKGIAAKVVARYLYDSYLVNVNPAIADTWGLKNLDPRSFSYQSIGPYADGFFGVEVTFDVFNSVDLVYADDDWEE